LFTIVIPKGVNALARGSASPGWTEAILPCGLTPRCSVLLLASATKASAYLAPGASGTVSVRFTPTATGTLAFPLIGIGNGLFTATSTPTISVAGAPIAPAGLQITSITENGSTVSILHAGTSFQVTYEVVDSQGHLVTSPDLSVSLSALDLGPLASLTAAPVLSHDGVGVISATYLGPNITGLNLQLNSGSLTSPTAAVDVVGGAVKVTLTPGLNITITVGDISLPTGTATAILQHGAYGNVNLSVGACAGEPGCKISEVGLLGDFGGVGSNNPALYSNDDPAAMDWGCNPATCKPVAGSGALSDLQQREFALHQVQVASSATTDEPKFETAPPCSPPGGSTGVIANPDATFCVDVNAISRSTAQCDGQNCSMWAGNLTIPVLFVNDPRFSFG
jgi:hypothetical protein